MSEEKIKKAIIGLSEAMYSLVDVIEEQERKRREEKKENSNIWAVSGVTVFVLMIIGMIVTWAIK